MKTEDGKDEKKGGGENGNRAVVVVDRGWIFAGDVAEVGDRIVLTRALHVFGWDRLGFPAMLENPGSKEVDLRPVKDVVIPLQCEIFRVPVGADWGLKK